MAIAAPKDYGDDAQIAEYMAKILNPEGGHTADMVTISAPDTLHQRMTDVGQKEDILKAAGVRTDRLHFLLQALDPPSQEFDATRLLGNRTATGNYIETSRGIFYDVDAVQITDGDIPYIGLGGEEITMPGPLTQYLRIGWRKNGDAWQRIVFEGKGSLASQKDFSGGVIISASRSLENPSCAILTYEEAFERYPNGRRALRGFFVASERRGVPAKTTA